MKNVPTIVGLHYSGPTLFWPPNTISDTTKLTWATLQLVAIGVDLGFMFVSLA